MMPHKYSTIKCQINHDFKWSSFSSSMYCRFSDKCIVANFGIQYIEKFGQMFSTYCPSKFRCIAFSVIDVCKLQNPQEHRGQALNSHHDVVGSILAGYFSIPHCHSVINLSCPTSGPSRRFNSINYVVNKAYLPSRGAVAKSVERPKGPSLVQLYCTDVGSIPERDHLFSYAAA